MMRELLQRTLLLLDDVRDLADRSERLGSDIAAMGGPFVPPTDDADEPADVDDDVNGS